MQTFLKAARKCTSTPRVGSKFVSAVCQAEARNHGLGAELYMWIRLTGGCVAFLKTRHCNRVVGSSGAVC